MEPTTNNNFDFFSFTSEIERALVDNPEVQEAVQKAKENTSNEQLSLETIPDQETRKHGKLAAVRLDGLALTMEGEITKTHFFERLELANDAYKDIVLSAEQARKLQASYLTLSTGVNSVVPLTCTADRCPFAKSCPYFLEDVAPIGRPCPVEYHLINYHTKMFMREFDVEMINHSQVMLVQELAELVVYEMRATRILGKEENNQLRGLQTKFDPEGNEFEEEVIHWAWKLKESIKSRRTKIVETLYNLKKAKDSQDNEKDTELKVYHNLVRNVLEKVTHIQAQAIVEANVVDIRDESMDIIDEIESESGE